jgi:hypothetical protein
MHGSEATAMKQMWDSLKHRTKARAKPGAVDPDRLKALVRAIMTTRPDEIGCDACMEQTDRFVEMTLAGKNARQAVPLVRDHLERCPDCREEFEALAAALSMMA